MQQILERTHTEVKWKVHNLGLLFFFFLLAVP